MCLLGVSSMSEDEVDTPLFMGEDCNAVVEAALSSILLVGICIIDGREVSLCLSSEQCFFDGDI